jgi:hypothetical protein
MVKNNDLSDVNPNVMRFLGYIMYVNPIFKVYVIFFLVHIKMLFWQTADMKLLTLLSEVCSTTLSPPSTFSF